MVHPKRITKKMMNCLTSLGSMRPPFNRSGLIPRGLPRLSFARKRESRKRSWIPGQARNDGYENGARLGRYPAACGGVVHSKA